MTKQNDPQAHTRSEVDRLFSNIEPRAGHRERYASLRVAAAVFARMIEDVVPPGECQTAAIWKVREALNTANDGMLFESEAESAYYAQRSGVEARR
jgi:hypothetical protein